MTSTTPARTAVPTVRASPLAGLGHWLRSFGLMMSYEFRRTRVFLPLALAVQVLIGSGLVIGFGLLLGEIPPTAALYLSTGVTVISMITIGFVLAPQLIAQQKIAGTYEYLWSLPVPRTTSRWPLVSLSTP